MRYEYSDGGRAASGFRGEARDCAVRAAAIAAGRDYQVVYDEINEMARGWRGKRKSSSREGVHRDLYHAYLEDLGFEWVPTMKIGEGCRVHLREGEIPQGQVIVRLSRHYCAVLDGVVYDNHDPRRGGGRCVYGYWWRD